MCALHILLEESDHVNRFYSADILVRQNKRRALGALNYDHVYCCI